MWTKKLVKKTSALILIVVIGSVLIYALYPYVNAFLAAFILFVLFKPLFNVFVKWRFNHSFSALLVIVISIFAVLLPLSLLVSIIAKELQVLFPQFLTLLRSSPWLNSYWDNWFNGLSIGGQLAEFGNTARSLLGSFASAISGQVVNYVIMYFLLFFLLTADDDKLKEKIYSLVPFSETNAARLASEFRNITYGTLLTSGLIALLQGSLMTIGFLMFNLPGAFLWGLVATLSSFVPLVGVSFVWILTSVYLLLSGNWLAGLGFIAWGTFISTIDNFVRPLIQKKVAQIHPFVSLLGIFAGLSLFGIIGIVLGPLLLCYFLLTLGMFKQEYIKD